MSLFTTGPKKPTSSVSSVLNVFTKAIDDLKAVIAEHTSHAEAQLKVAADATAAAQASQSEAELAERHIEGLRVALGVSQATPAVGNKPE